MSRFNAIATLATFLFVISQAAHTLTPTEFLQHIQQQQQLQQQMQLMQQEQPSMPQDPPAAQVAAPEEKTDNKQAEPSKETFKPFTGKGPTTLKGCFSFADETSNNTKIPSFRIMFKGKETRSDDEGFFSLPVDEENLDQYSLVITKNIQQAFDKHNTIQGLKLLPNKHYKYYTYQKHNTQWVHHEKKIDGKHLMLPTNALVILIDPKYIDQLDEWNIDLRNNFIKLPKIVLKKEIKHKPTERAAAKSLLTSLDTTIFHEEVREEIKHPTERVKIALAH